MSEIRRVAPHLPAIGHPAPKITKSDRTRAVILDAALDFLWSHPFREMSVNALMASTVHSRSAFYQYFEGIHQLMETLLDMLEQDIFASVSPWLEGVGDPVVLTNEMLGGLIRTCYRHGPFLKAVSDAGTSDKRFDKGWAQFLGAFDDAACARIEADQAQGLTPNFDPRPVSVSLNRLNAYSIIAAFGLRPRSQPEPVREALARIWISTLYGAEWLEKGASNLVRK